MTWKTQPDGWPPHLEDGQLQWHFPSACWSGEKYGEDMIKVTLDIEEREWWGYTEMDQCVSAISMTGTSRRSAMNAVWTRG